MRGNERLKLTGHCAAAGIITAVVLCAAFAAEGIVPFGSNTLAVTDARVQYLDLFAYYRDVLTGQNTAGATFSYMLGTGMAGVFSYYLASPFNLLVLLFPKEQMNLFLTVLAALKLSAAAMTFRWFLARRYGGRLSPAPALALSVSYGLMQYDLAQASNIMWLDGVILLPVMLAFVSETVWKEKRQSAVSLAAATALSLLCAWYTGAINCLFSLVWFVYESVRAGSARGAGRYATGMALGGLMSSALMVPNIMALRLGKGASVVQSQALTAGFRGNPLGILSHYRIGAMSDAHQVSLYCGVLPVIGIGLFAAREVLRRRHGSGYGDGYGDEGRRDLPAAAGLLAFVVLMYYWQPLFFVFSLFRDVDSYWSRYGYLGCFVLLTLAAEGIRTDRLGNLGNVYEGRLSSTLKRIAGAALIAAVCVNLFMEASAMFNIYHSDTARQYENYSARAQEQIAAIREYEQRGGAAPFYRINETSTRTYNVDGLTSGYQDPLAYGYASVGGYTSCPENDQLAFLDSIGYREEYNSFNIVNTAFLPADALLGVRYELSGYALPGLVEVEEIKERNHKSVYYNPYALPAAVLFPREEAAGNDADAAGTAAGRSGAGAPFMTLEEIYSALYGAPAELFMPVEAQETSADGRTTWTLNAPEGNYALYGNIPWEEPFEGKLSAREGERYGYGVWLSPSVFWIEERGDGQAAVTLEARGRAPISDPRFYALSLDRLGEVTQSIRRQSAGAEVLTWDGRRIHVKVQTDSPCSLLLSAAASPGWEILVNGQRAEAGKFGKCLLCLPLEEGTWDVVLQYRTPGLVPGAALTALGILLCALYVVRARRCKGS